MDSMDEIGAGLFLWNLYLCLSDPTGVNCVDAWNITRHYDDYCISSNFGACRGLMAFHRKAITIAEAVAGDCRFPTGDFGRRIMERKA